MSADMLTHTCAACGAEESLDGLLNRMIDDDQVRRLIADVLTHSFPLGGLVVRYLRLHKPPKQKLRMSIVAKLLAELVPDVQRAAIQRNGRTWPVSAATWEAGVQAVFDAVEKGSLTVPLQGNGYLYTVVMRMADRTEAAQERQVEAERRHRDAPGAAGPATTTVPPMTVQRPPAEAVPTVSKAEVEASRARLAGLRNEIAMKGQR